MTDEHHIDTEERDRLDEADEAAYEVLTGVGYCRMCGTQTLELSSDAFCPTCDELSREP